MNNAAKPAPSLPRTTDEINEALRVMRTQADHARELLRARGIDGGAVEDMIANALHA